LKKRYESDRERERDNQKRYIKRDIHQVNRLRERLHTKVVERDKTLKLRIITMRSLCAKAVLREESEEKMYLRLIMIC
jgi:hypothetical protein